MKLFATSFAVVFGAEKPVSFLPVVSRKPGALGVEVFRSADELSTYLQSLTAANEGATSAAANVYTSLEGCSNKEDEFFRVSYHASTAPTPAPVGDTAAGLFDAPEEAKPEATETTGKRRGGSANSDQ